MTDVEKEAEYKLDIYYTTPNDTLVKIGKKGIKYELNELFASPPNINAFSSCTREST